MATVIRPSAFKRIDVVFLQIRAADIDMFQEGQVQELGEEVGVSLQCKVTSP